MAAFKGAKNGQNLTRKDLKDYCPASNLAFNEEIKTLIKEGREIYHFGFGQAPFPVVPSMVRELAKYAGENAYLEVAGIPELRQQVADFHKKYDNIPDIDIDNIIVGPGTKELLFLLETVFDGDILLVSPSWTTYFPQATLAHHQPHIIPTSLENEWRITPESIENIIKTKNLKGNKLLILCNPDNPTSTTYKAQHLKKLSEVFRKHNILVVSDEIYARLEYNQAHESLMKFYPEGTIISSGFSKWASAGGWRLGYQIYPNELKQLKDAVRSAGSHTYSCAPAPIQFAVAKGLENVGECEDYIKHTCRILQVVGDYCHRELTSVGIKCLKPEAGYYCFPDLEICRDVFKKRGIANGSQMCDVILREANVALISGGPAFLRPENEFTVRLCFVNFNGERALEASRKLGLGKSLTEDFVKEYAGPTYEGIRTLKKWVESQLKS